MKKYKQETVTNFVYDKTVCDICGKDLDSAKRLSAFILNIYPNLMFGISIWHENFTVNIVKPFKPLINPPLIWEGHPVNYK